MKKKLIALLSFIMILALSVVACNKPSSGNTSESESISIESTSTSAEESLDKESSSEQFSEEQSESEKQTDSEEQSEIESESETHSETESESEPSVDEYVSVVLNYHFADGVRDYHGSRMAKKGSTLEEIIMDCCPDGTQERFLADLVDFLVDGQSVWGTDWTLQENCEVALVFGTLRFQQNIFDVGIRIVDENETVLLEDVTRIFSHTTVRYLLIEKFLFTEEELSHVVSMSVNGEAYDFSSNLLSDCLLILVVDQPISNKLTTTLIVKEADGTIVYNESEISSRKVSVQGLLLNVYMVFDEYYFDIDEIRVNGQIADINTKITENNSVIEITLCEKLPEEILVDVIVDRDGQREQTNGYRIEEGIEIEQFVYNFFEGDEQAFCQIEDVLVNGESVWFLTEWFIDESCEITIVMSSSNLEQNVYITFIEAKEDGSIVSIIEIFVEKGRSIESYLRTNLLVEEQDLDRIVSISIDGVYVDLQTEIQDSCQIYLVFETNDVQDQQITVYLNGEERIVEENTNLRDFLENCGIDVNTYYVYVNGESAVLEYTLCNGDQITTEPMGDMGGHNVWFDYNNDSEVNMDEHHFILPNTTLESFVNEYVVYNWSYVYSDYQTATENGYFTINGAMVERDQILYAEDVVAYVHFGGNGEDCTHNFDENGYCPNCGYTCTHTTYEADVPCDICGVVFMRSVRVTLFIFSAYFDEYGNCLSIGYSSNEHVEYLFYNEQSTTVGQIIRQNTGYGMSEECEEGYCRNWTKNGVSTYEDDFVENGDYLIGLPEGVEIQPFTVTIEVEDGQTREYTYSYPIPLDKIKAKFISDVGNIDLSYYDEIVVNNYCSDVIVWEDTTIRYQLSYSNVTFTVIDENGTSEVINDRFIERQKPTITQYLNQKGIDPNEYYIYDHYSLIDDLEAFGKQYYYVTAIKKSVVPEEIVVNVTIHDEHGVGEFSAIFDKPICLGELWTGFETVDGQFIYIGFEREKIFEVNGVKYNFINTGDFSFVYIYDYTEIVVTRGMHVSLQVENIFNEIILEETLTGAELLEFFNVEVDCNQYVIRCNEVLFGSEAFLTQSFPVEGFNYAYVVITQGRVHVSWNYDDELGNFRNGVEERESGISFSEIFTEEEFNSCTWRVYRDMFGTLELLDIQISYDTVLAFDSLHSDYFETSNYRIEGTSKYFTVMLEIEGQNLGQKKFSKEDNLTFGQILAEFGDYQYQNYSWTFSGNVDSLEENSFVNASVQVYGYDMRPRITVEVAGETYLIYHTGSMTLADVLGAIHENYGERIYYDDHIWDYALTDVVAEAGYWSYVTARDLTSVEVTFYSQNGPAWFEDDGTSTRTYTRQSDWVYPTCFANIDMYQGIFVPTGRWEYHTEENGQPIVKIVSSINELFALGKESVELIAEFETNTEILRGTYFLGEKDVWIIGESTLSYVDTYTGEIKVDNQPYELLYMGEIVIQVDGYNMPISYFLGETKVESDEVVILAYHEFGYTYHFYSFEDYQNFAENYQVISFTNVYGEDVEFGEYGTVYVARVKDVDYE